MGFNKKVAAQSWPGIWAPWTAHPTGQDGTPGITFPNLAHQYLILYVSLDPQGPSDMPLVEHTKGEELRSCFSPERESGEGQVELREIPC